MEKAHNRVYASIDLNAIEENFENMKKNLTPERSGVRYENVFHGSTLLASKKMPLVSSVTGEPVPAYISVGSSEAVACSGSGKSRLQPAAAPLCCHSRAASSSTLFDIVQHYTTVCCPCQGHIFPLRRELVLCVLLTRQPTGYPGPPGCRTAAPPRTAPL